MLIQINSLYFRIVKCVSYDHENDVRNSLNIYFIISTIALTILQIVILR